MTLDWFALIVRGATVCAIALTCVLLLRLPLRRLLGARVAYGFWALVPMCLVAGFIPAPTEVVIGIMPGEPLVRIDAIVRASATQPWDMRPLFVAIWLLGCSAMLLWSVFQQRRYSKQLGGLQRRADGVWFATTHKIGPALVGAIVPRIIVPSNFESIYAAAEQTLVVAHERAHLRRGDAQCNVLAVLMRSLNWFNPLFHFAASRFRFDQELACDALVIARFPHSRATYAAAMLKAQLIAREHTVFVSLPAGCQWPATHPLMERIAMLKRPLPSFPRVLCGAVFATAIVATASYTAWASQTPTKIEATSVAGGEVQVDISHSVNNVVGGHLLQTRHLGADHVTHDSWPDADPTKPEWSLDYSVSAVGADRFMFSATIKQNGNTLSMPSLLAMAGKPLSLAVSAPALVAGQAPEAFTLTVSISRVADEAPLAPSANKNPPVADVPEATAVKTGTAIPHDSHAADMQSIAASAGVNASNVESTDVVVISTSAPKYPKQAVTLLTGAHVILKVRVDAHGIARTAEIDSLKLIVPTHSTLSETDRAALIEHFASTSKAAALTWKFQPGRKEGRAVEGYVLVPIDFNMCEGKERCDDANDVKASDAQTSDAEAVVIRTSAPKYPKEAIVLREGAHVVLKVLVDVHGTPRTAEIETLQLVDAHGATLSDSDRATLRDQFASISKAAALSWRYQPARKSGLASDGYILVPINFNLCEINGPCDGSGNVPGPV